MAGTRSRNRGANGEPEQEPTLPLASTGEGTTPTPPSAPVNAPTTLPAAQEEPSTSRGLTADDIRIEEERQRRGKAPELHPEGPLNPDNEDEDIELTPKEVTRFAKYQEQHAARQRA